jgi:hypothetical protein
MEPAYQQILRQQQDTIRLQAETIPACLNTFMA